MENKLVEGLFVNNPRENAPDFVKGGLSINVGKFVDYLHQNANARGYVNIDLLVSKDGKLYAKLNDWKPTEKPMTKDEEIEIADADSEIDVKNIPF